MDTAAPWRFAVVGDGRFDQAGLYAPDGTRVAAAEMLAVPQTRQFAVAVPGSALGGLDPATARTGRPCSATPRTVRASVSCDPSTTLDYWTNPPRAWSGSPSSVSAAVPARSTSASRARDTDTRDPNALDVIVGPGQSQAEVLDWTTGAPVQLPMLPLQP